MQVDQIEAIAAAAEKSHKGNLTQAIGEFLGADFSNGIPIGFEAAAGGIEAEIKDYPNRLASENYDANGGDNYTIAAALGNLDVGKTPKKRPAKRKQVRRT